MQLSYDLQELTRGAGLYCCEQFATASEQHMAWGTIYSAPPEETLFLRGCIASDSSSTAASDSSENQNNAEESSGGIL